MFERTETSLLDPIVALSREYAADDRRDKINLGIGVYRDSSGATPILDCVKKAEEQLVAEQRTKDYVGVAGDDEFVRQLSAAVLPSLKYGSEIVGVQSVGGSGALRVLLDTAVRISPSTALWMSEPTWPNHKGIASAVGIDVRHYSYPGFKTGFDLDGLFAELAPARPGDLFLVHACCHNPTGIDPLPEELAQIADFLSKRGIVPLIDAAYLGFGQSLETDSARVATFVDRCPELLLAVSCSKNFSIYRERTGAAYLIGRAADNLINARSVMMSIARESYSMPPDHGARVVSKILGTPELKAGWQSELSAIQQTIARNRRGLAAALRHHCPDRDWDYLDQGHGMFGLIDAPKERILKLRRDKGIYIVDDGRLNVAALNENTIEFTVTSIVDILMS